MTLMHAQNANLLTAVPFQILCLCLLDSHIFHTEPVSMVLLILRYEFTNLTKKGNLISFSSKQKMKNLLSFAEKK